jgi:hypothetical protein
MTGRMPFEAAVGSGRVQVGLMRYLTPPIKAPGRSQAALVARGTQGRRDVLELLALSHRRSESRPCDRDGRGEARALRRLGARGPALARANRKRPGRSPRGVPDSSAQIGRRSRCASIHAVLPTPACADRLASMDRSSLREVRALAPLYTRRGVGAAPEVR